MNRIIKFRGKSIHTEEWHYGDLVQPSNNAYFIQERGTAGFFSIPDTIGQFTGLFDKKGKEIYDGDILQWNNRHIIVEWNNYECGWNIVEYGIHKYEVIGNIHDNPELIY